MDHCHRYLLDKGKRGSAIDKEREEGFRWALAHFKPGVEVDETHFE